MANLDFLLVCTFDYFLQLVLVAGHAVNNLNLGNDKRFEDEGYKGD